MKKDELKFHPIFEKLENCINGVDNMNFGGRC